jgi:hypothetical protein
MNGKAKFMKAFNQVDGYSRCCIKHCRGEIDEEIKTLVLGTQSDKNYLPHVEEAPVPADFIFKNWHHNAKNRSYYACISWTVALGSIFLMFFIIS